jgi:predicted lipoprotein with Yx(FWY)xxD motif
MKQLLSTRLIGLAIVLGAIGASTMLVAAAQAKVSSKSRATGTVVALRQTAIGTILVDSRGRTLYLFEKDRNGVSMCNTACMSYWPALTSHATPHAGQGVKQSLLQLSRAHNGVRQVTYAGHPLYTFVGDKRAGQTAGEGLSNFGAEWYALAPSGQKVEHSQTASSGSGPGGGYGSPGGYGAGSGGGY